MEISFSSENVPREKVTSCLRDHEGSFYLRRVCTEAHLASDSNEGYTNGIVMPPSNWLNVSKFEPLLVWRLIPVVIHNFIYYFIFDSKILILFYLSSECISSKIILIGLGTNE